MATEPKNPFDSVVVVGSESNTKKNAELNAAKNALSSNASSSSTSSSTGAKNATTVGKPSTQNAFTWTSKLTPSVKTDGTATTGDYYDAVSSTASEPSYGGDDGDYYTTYSMGSATSEDELTDKEKQAAENQKSLSAFDRASLLNQFNSNMANYDFMDERNRQLTDAKNQQAGRKADLERFNQHRIMMNAFNATRNASDGALRGSGASALARQTYDFNDYLNTQARDSLQSNLDANENEYLQARNSNDYARNELAINTEKQLADIESNLAAYLNNINPKLYAEPTRPADETVDENTPLDQPLSSRGFADGYLIDAALKSGYVTPQQLGLSYDDIRNNRQATNRSDYFGQLVGKR